MDVEKLRASQARTEELGPVPANQRAHEIWIEERRGAIVLLAGLADWNRQLLPSAATREWVTIAARDLLLAAMNECP